MEPPCRFPRVDNYIRLTSSESSYAPGVGTLYGRVVNSRGERVYCTCVFWIPGRQSDSSCVQVPCRNGDFTLHAPLVDELHCMVYYHPEGAMGCVAPDNLWGPGQFDHDFDESHHSLSENVSRNYHDEWQNNCNTFFTVIPMRSCSRSSRCKHITIEI